MDTQSIRKPKPYFVTCFAPLSVKVSKIFNSLSAVLITGGTYWDVEWNKLRDHPWDRKTSELYLPLSGNSCRLPDIIPNNKHTQDNLLLCGGDVGLMWSPLTSTWNQSITPNPARRSHVSWSPGPDIGIFLIGGVAGIYLTSLVYVPITIVVPCPHYRQENFDE